MNEEWVMDKIHEASKGGGLVKIDPESAEPHFFIGVSGEAIPPSWGDIIGDIRDQADLASSLNSKIEKIPGTPEIKFGSDDGGIFVDVEDSA